jgi:hypothetical protein
MVHRRVLLGHSTVSITAVVFIDNLGRQLISVNNTYTTGIRNNRVHDLVTW